MCFRSFVKHTSVHSLLPIACLCIVESLGQSMIYCTSICSGLLFLLSLQCWCWLPCVDVGMYCCHALHCAYAVCRLIGCRQYNLHHVAVCSYLSALFIWVAPYRWLLVRIDSNVSQTLLNAHTLLCQLACHCNLSSCAGSPSGSGSSPTVQQT